MKDNYSRRNFIKLAGAGLIGLYGCNEGGKSRGKPNVFEPNKSFASNTGEVDYYEFFGKNGKGEITHLVTRYNSEDPEIRDVTGIEENGLLISGGIPLRIKKQITDNTNVLKVYAIDNKGRKSGVETDTFFIPDRKSVV